ncbi:MAG: SUF system NifU family Fe-S cluster assembly protein [Acidimicrobiales bacterium]|nr:SUF system NifU family Fe-S cluster assembly protein [Acidimicrobiales bacterium]
MPGLEDLYREIILDHYRSPRNRGELDTPPASRTEGFNPLCGDEIVIYLILDDPSKGDQAIVTDVKIGGQGCSISQSSASMMSVTVLGKTIEEVHQLTQAFKSMMSIHEHDIGGDGSEAEAGVGAVSGVENPSDAVSLGDLEALRGVVKFPVRIKCATLGWNTLNQALDDLLNSSV